MAFVKIHDLLLRSSIMEEELPVRWAWVVILTLAGPDGRFRATPEALARTANLPQSDMDAALHTLMEPDPNSTSLDEDGRRLIMEGTNLWRCVNYEIYRHLLSEEDRREKTRERVRRFRERKKAGNADGTPCNGGNDIAEAEAEAEAEADTHQDVAWCAAVWNDVAKANGLPVVRVMSAQRARVARRRIAQHGVAMVRRALEAPGTSKFLRGAVPTTNGTGEGPWKATFDWMMKLDNMTKVLEGNYDDRKPVVPPHMLVGQSPPDNPYHPDDVREFSGAGGGNLHRRWDEYWDWCYAHVNMAAVWPRFDVWCADHPEATP
jgi:hypothetical protein